MVCKKCAALPEAFGYGFDGNLDGGRLDPDPSALKSHRQVRHHTTYADLDNSARSGCTVCMLFKKALLKAYVQGLHVSVKEVKRLHRRCDRRLQVSRAEGTQPLTAFFVWLDYFKITVPIYLPNDEGFVGLVFARCFLQEREDGSISNSGPPSDITAHVWLSSRPDGAPAREWGVLGRDPTTTVDFSLARGWIHDCLNNHEECTKTTDSLLPSRVLDLGSADGLNLRLLVNERGEHRGSYATLSHCWGTSQPLKLLKANYSEFRGRIRYQELPRTFQDAVVATRSLGLRYLWIDSLCIIQDSDVDWEEQCAKMAHIYKSSFVTLSAPEASDNRDGFLCDRRAPLFSTTVQFSTGKISCSISLSLLNHTNRRLYNTRSAWSFLREPDTSPLSERAWVMQEALLSGRVLSFTADQMYMECRKFARTDRLHHPVAGWAKRKRTYRRHNFSLRSLSELTDIRRSHESWRDLVSHYATLELTKGTDKLPALSGLASEVHQATGDQYLAGLWLEDLPWGLIWKSTFVPSLPLDSPYVAPSWSWASAGKASIDWSKDFVAESDGFFPDENEPQLCVTAVGITPSGQDPFGMVKEGSYLEVLGKTLPPGCLDIDEPLGSWQVSLDMYESGVQHGALGSFYWDNEAYILGAKRGVFGYWLLLLGFDNLGGGAALALEPVSGQPRTFRRVGLVEGRERSRIADTTGRITEPDDRDTSDWESLTDGMSDADDVDGFQTFEDLFRDLEPRTIRLV
ncbi:heterokaryon incompatibility protein-domain-containing protein [Lasiosphaeria hispida]|uniref:Heterokaryon incompatibility protein-domain-containing protein n=1 Tax=Lasiosphaeria hispida TaxID=260671 RepID=A0AAJ0H7D7_9PEZI|nr:heterokaryon incompatibility protein-domain-containing protein [Lasiosphaeria hispida]